RKIPLITELVTLLKVLVADRNHGPVFRRRRFLRGDTPKIKITSPEAEALEYSILEVEGDNITGTLDRRDQMRKCDRFWRDMGSIREEAIRVAFMELTDKIGLPQLTSPKLLRH